jgi:hypothetical protein
MCVCELLLHNNSCLRELPFRRISSVCVCVDCSLAEFVYVYAHCYVGEIRVGALYSRLAPAMEGYTGLGFLGGSENLFSTGSGGLNQGVWTFTK